MQRLVEIIKIIGFFFLGAFITGIILTAVSYLFFTAHFQNRVYPGVKINQIDFTGASVQDVSSYFSRINLTSINFEISDSSHSASLSATASDLGIKIDNKRLARNALSIGRQTNNPYYNLLQIYSAYRGDISLPLEVTLNSSALKQKLDTLAPLIEKAPINAVFEFNPTAGPDQRGRVQAFTPSRNGLAIDRDMIAQQLILKTKDHLSSQLANNKSLTINSVQIIIPLYTKILFPDIASSTADQYGLHELLGEGISYYTDSIPNRIYNLHLGSQKVSGSLIAPNEIFSFDQSIGTVSAIFGFQKAYSIIKGKTVLDDGGGVCQVSTTVYRAVLNAGLPVIARTAHTYRVGFYEEGGYPPGLDATVYPPDPDLKFKNDTNHWLLLQASFDETRQKLTFDIFGTSDGRQTKILGPYILSTSPPPDTVYEDDPTKPIGTITQVDTAHWGAKVYFKREVARNGETLINETVSSDYIPWPARFLRGTKT